MLRITVDLFPHGDKDKKQTLAVMDIWNDGTSTDEEYGNYRYHISNKYRQVGLPKIIRGLIQGFPRLELTAWDLIYRILKNKFGDCNNE